MAEMISGTTSAETWLKAAEFLFKAPKNECVHLFLDIKEPTIRNVADKNVSKIVSKFLSNNGANPVDTVAETIFPITHYLSDGIEGVFKKYPADMAEFFDGRPTDKGWGNYALRMIEQQTCEGKPFNALEDVLIKLSGDNKKATFEINPGRLYADWDSPENCPELPIYDPALDRKKPLGTPCLSHLSFTREGKNLPLHLNATYRSHHYIGRALGNLIGLGGLLAFVCLETDHPPGSLGINATFAKLECSDFGGKKKTGSLLEECRAMYDMLSASDSEQKVEV